MHKRSFSMRGGSVVGAVLVVALLSAAVVALESQKVHPTGMFAAGATPALGTSATTLEKESEKEEAAETAPAAGTQGTICVKGYDYAIYESQGKAVVSCRSVINNCAPAPKISTVDAQGKTTTAPCTPPPGQYLSNMTQPANPGTSRQCTSAWRCRYFHCSSAYKEGCKFMDDAGEGESIESKKVITKAANDISAEELAKLNVGDTPEFKPLSTGESEFSKALIEKQDEVLVEDIAKAEADYQTRLAALSSCQQQNSAVNASACASESSAVAAARVEADAKQERLEAMRKYAQDLGGKSVVLCVTGGFPCSPTTPAPSEIEYENSSIVTPGTLGQEPPPNGQRECGVWNFLCRNTGHQDELTRACQAGNQSACMQLYGGGSGGVGAYSGYGGAHPSGGAQPCGASQQRPGGRGILGMALSLFLKSSSSGNGNCVNGVPVPSCTITATPKNITSAGQQVTLSWQSQQAFSATLSSHGGVAAQGSMTVNPQQTTTYTLSLNGYVDNRSGQQLHGQCSMQVTVGGQGGGDGAPKAEISCRPEEADVGMSVALSYACRNSSTSGGTGFDTNNQMSGSATPIVESPTIGSNTVKYGLTCSKEGKTDTAECTVKINKPTIVLISNPKEVISGGEANIGWVTGGMEECTISSRTLSGFTAENAGNTSTSGVAKTPPLSQDTKFVLSCTTKAGATKTAETTVTIR